MDWSDFSSMGLFHAVMPGEDTSPLTFPIEMGAAKGSFPREMT